MIAAISERAAELEKLCVQYHVQRLDLFGSAVTGDHRQGASDLDFLVEFRSLPAGGYGDTYFGLLEGLERLFGGPVDLMSIRRSGILTFDNALRRAGRGSMWIEALK